jgi:hypothetical protein
MLTLAAHCTTLQNLTLTDGCTPPLPAIQSLAVERMRCARLAFVDAVKSQHRGRRLTLNERGGRPPLSPVSIGYFGIRCLSHAPQILDMGRKIDVIAR